MFWNVSKKNYDIGILIIRLSLGLGFLYFRGWDKLTDGPERWTSLGAAMGHIGIDFGHTYFGFMAAFSESIAALFIAVGFLFQPMLALLSFTMVVAGYSHIAKGKGSPAHAFTYAGIILGMMYIGPGKYSVDAYLASKFAPTSAPEE